MADVDVAKLAELARIELTAHEAEQFEKEFESILAYVSQLGDSNAAEGVVNLWGQTNAWREDGEPHAPGICTRELLAEAPRVEEGRVAVKKIL